MVHTKPCLARAKRGAPAAKLVTDTEEETNILLLILASSVVHWSIANKAHWAIFDQFLEESLQRAREHDPNGQAVFTFDNAPAC